MSEEFWWRHCGFFYEAARRSQLVQNVHSGFFRNLDTLNLPAGTKTLDAGCGSGNSTFPLAERGYNVLAVDFGESVLNRAVFTNRKRFGYENITFGLMDLSRTLPLRNETFDLIASLHCIMKIENIDFTLNEFFRVLTPGGYAVISTTPDAYTIPEWLKRYVDTHGWRKALWDIRWLAVWAVPYFMFTRKPERRREHRWNEAEFSRRMETAGFKTLHLERVPYINVGCLIGVFEK